MASGQVSGLGTGQTEGPFENSYIFVTGSEEKFNTDVIWGPGKRCSSRKFEYIGVLDRIDVAVPETRRFPI
jgi:hypothetical protein